MQNFLFRLLALLLTYAFFLPVSTAERAPYITVEADYFELNAADEKAYFRGNVEATQGNSTFHSSQLTLRLEQITSHHSRDGTSSGNSAPNGQQNYEHGANALNYDISQDMINGSGDSELRRGNELIRADEISYAVAQRIAYARPTEAGRVRVPFDANPGMPMFPEGLVGARAAD